MDKVSGNLKIEWRILLKECEDICNCGKVKNNYYQDWEKLTEQDRLPPMPTLKEIIDTTKMSYLHNSYSSHFFAGYDNNYYASYDKSKYTKSEYFERLINAWESCLKQYADKIYLDKGFKNKLTKSNSKEVFLATEQFKSRFCNELKRMPFEWYGWKECYGVDKIEFSGEEIKLFRDKLIDGVYRVTEQLINVMGLQEWKYEKLINELTVMDLLMGRPV